MSFGYQCPVCQMAQIVARRMAAGLKPLPDEPPPIPRFLPDGSPFAPEQPT